MILRRKCFSLWQKVKNTVTNATTSISPIRKKERALREREREIESAIGEFNKTRDEKAETFKQALKENNSASDRYDNIRLSNLKGQVHYNHISSIRSGIQDLTDKLKNPNLGEVKAYELSLKLNRLKEDLRKERIGLKFWGKSHSLKRHVINERYGTNKGAKWLEKESEGRYNKAVENYEHAKEDLYNYDNSNEDRVENLHLEREKLNEEGRPLRKKMDGIIRDRIILGAVGLGAAGLGYGIYKWRKNKRKKKEEEEKNNSTK